MKNSLYKLMAPAAIMVLLSACNFGETAPKPLEIGESATISVMTTTDTHGWVTPWDYASDTEDPRFGLSKIATIVDSIRNIHPNNLLIDAGDWLQGNSFAEYFAKDGIDSPNYPALRVAEAIEFDAMVLGNHEFNFGVDYLNKRISQTKIPILGGNVFATGSDTPAYTPYIMKNVGGVKVVIIGLTTPGSAVWDRPRVENRLNFTDGVLVAAKYVEEVRTAGAQFVIVLAHTSMGPGSSYDVPGVAEENFGERMLATVDGIDLFVFGHSHRVTDDVRVVGPSGKEIPIIQAGRWASHLGEAIVTITRTDENTFSVETISTKAHSVEHIESSAKIEALVAADHEKVRREINLPLATTPDTWDASNARLGDTPIVDLIHKVQFEITGAQLSAASAFNTDALFEPGTITRRDIAMIYPYENMLFKIEVTGAQIRAFLEHTSQYYQGVERGNPVVTPNFPGYNFDNIAGLTYEMDIRRRVGQRITRLQYENRNVGDSDVFTMAVNSYRAVGGGGFTMLSDVEVLWESDISVREMMEQYLLEKGTITHADVYTQNWYLVWR